MDSSKRLLATVLMLLCAACQRSPSVSERIASQIGTGATKLDIGQLASFNWDELFVFGPYDDPKTMCEAINIPPADCSWAGFNEVDEGEFLLVFMKGEKIVRRESLSRFVADFDQTCLRKAVARVNAHFVVDRRSSRVYLMCSG
jgi:hypothetical protein